MPEFSAPKCYRFSTPDTATATATAAPSAVSTSFPLENDSFRRFSGPSFEALAAQADISKNKFSLVRYLAQSVIAGIQKIESLYARAWDQFEEKEERMASGLASGLGLSGFFVMAKASVFFPLTQSYFSNLPIDPEQWAPVTDLLLVDSPAIFTAAFVLNLLRGRNDSSADNLFKFSSYIISNIGVGLAGLGCVPFSLIRHGLQNWIKDPDSKQTDSVP